MASTSHSKPKQKPSNKQNGSSKLRGLPKDSPEVRISKTLSYILRHGAQKEGVPMRDDGYVKVTDLIANPKLKTLTLEAINDIVKADAKQRYDLISEEEEGGQIVWMIKANQGHSLKAVQLELKPVLAASDIPSGVAVHGTDMKAWKSISTAGLSKMNRNHVHLAQGLNAMSGMRRTANVLIWVDVQKALDDGIKFWLSNNGVVLTEGNVEGVIPTAYFSKVQDSDGSLIPLPST